MNSEDFQILVWVIGFYLISFVSIFVSRRDRKKMKQMEEDYDNAIEQIKELMHEKELLKQQLNSYGLINELVQENIDLRNQSTDTK